MDKNHTTMPPHISADEHDLLRSQQRKQALVFAGGQITWLTDAQGNIIDFSGWEEFTGQSPQAAQGWGWLEMVYSPDRKATHRACSKAFRKHVGYEIRFRAKRIDAVYRTILARGYPVLDDDGNILEWVGTCTDITEIAEAEHKEVLRRNELQTIIDCMSEALLIYNQQGQVTYINEVTRTLFPILRSATLPVVFPPPFIEVYNEQGDRMRYEDLPISRILRDGSSILASNAMILTAKRMDNVFLHLSHSGKPIRDENGNSIGAVMIITDVTEQYAVERRIHDALYVLLLLTETLVNGATLSINDIGSTVAELTKRIVVGTIITIVGIHTETGMMYPIATTSTPERTQRWRGRIQNVHINVFTSEILESFQRGESTVLEFSLSPNPQEGDDGLRRNLVVPVLSNGVVLGLILLEHRDYNHAFSREEIELVQGVGRLLSIVLQRQSTQQQHRSTEELEQTLHGMTEQFESVLRSFSHDLRTPLTVAKASVQFSHQLFDKIVRVIPHDETEALKRSEKIQDMLSRADDQISIESRLIDVLIDSSRLASNQLKLMMTQVNVMEMVYDVINHLPKDCSGRVEVRTTKKNYFAQIDHRRTIQAIEQILINALKFSPESANVTVRIREHAGKVHIAMSDHGPGIGTEYHEAIWERFYKVPTIHQQVDFGPSLGLGLYLARGLVELQSGHIHFESLPGQGSTFTIELPLT